MNRRSFLEKSFLAAGMVGMSGAGLAQFVNRSKELPNSDKMPVLFVGHGNPMNGIQSNEFSNKWKELGKTLPQPNAILAISAHWLTKGTLVTATEKPKTIHDFGGFPDELFQVHYGVNGNPKLAQNISSTINNPSIELDHEWGLDHGTWTVLNQMYPNANIPVLQLSIDYKKPAQFHYNLGKQLAFLRSKGVLIVGSGNMVHNLGMVGAPKGKALGPNTINEAFGYDWALEINETFKRLISSGNHQNLIDYHKLGKPAELAIPTPDHYFPLLYSLGLVTPSDKLRFFNDKCLAGSLSMTSVLIES